MADVGTMIAQQQALATSTMAQADTYLSQLVAIADTSLIGGTTILPTQYDYSSVPTVNFPIVGGQRGPLSTSTGAVPIAPAIVFADVVVDVPVADFNIPAPTLNFPSVPVVVAPASPGPTPVFNSPDIPTAPVVNLPVVPTFASIQLPSPPSIVMPTFAALAPPDDLTTPTAQFQFAEAAYNSVLLDPLRTKLLDNLLNGGYGIETADEIALFNRARDREVEAMQSRIEDAGRAMASRGFPLPPGELSIQIDRAYQDMQDKVSDASRDITLQRNKLYVENRQFTIREVKELEQITMNFWNLVQERSLNAAKLTVELSIAIYNTLVERYKARWAGYQAQATAYAEQIRGQLVQAEIYRTNVEAKNVEVQMQHQLVEVYLAQLRGVETAISIYRIEMEAANIKAIIERTKLEAFQAQVGAYTAEVQAEVAQFGLYRAQIDGETAKVNAFEAQVRAYVGEVTAAKTKADTQLMKFQVETEQARVKLAMYQGQLAGFDSNMKQVLGTGQLLMEQYRGDIDAARGTNDASIAKASLQQKVLEATVQQNIQISNMTIENARVRLLGTIDQLKFKTAAVQFGSEKFFGLLNALEGTVNTLAVQSQTT